MTSRGYIEEIRYLGPPEGERGYPYNLPFLQGMERVKLDRRVTFFIGENGSGKSTLLEAVAIACGFNPEGGSVNFRFSTRDSCSPLHERIALQRTLIRPKDSFFLRAESLYNVATEIENLDAVPAAAPKVIGSYGGLSLHEQSHGESFLALMENRFRGNGLYILDEPEAALSAERQLSFLLRMHALAEKNSQFMIATHSPVLLSYPYATIYSINGAKIEQREYTETEPYQFMKMFIPNYKQVLRHLLEQEEE